MINIENNVQFEDEFVVLDENDDTVSGLEQIDFSIALYNPEHEEVSLEIPITIIEIEDGLYKINFTPNQLGNWELIISNDDYFPWGKYGHYKSVKANPDTLFDYLERVIGLCQENFRVVNPVYDDKAGKLVSGRIKTYHNAEDAENDENVMAEYEVKATYGIGKYRNNVTGYISKKIG